MGRPVVVPHGQLVPRIHQIIVSHPLVLIVMADRGQVAAHARERVGGIALTEASLGQQHMAALQQQGGREACIPHGKPHA